MNTCNHCQSPIAGDEVVCSSCGVIVSQKIGGGISCENHAGEAAVACCTMCGKPVCGDCATSREGVFLCDAPEHHSGEERWSVLAVAANPFEADMISTNLIQAGIQTRVADPRNFAGTLWFSGHLNVLVLVERSALGPALDLLRSTHLLSSES